MTVFGVLAATLVLFVWNRWRYDVVALLASLYKHMRGEADVTLIDAESKFFSSGVLITTAYLAKGLEFDEIIVPFCNASEYNSPIDRHMLYVAVTRAMHGLTITYTGQASPFLAEAAAA